MSVKRVAERVRAEFAEMPGLSLTESQAARLFGIEREVCRTVIASLVDDAYLRKTASGAIMRSDR
jgi:hypothetical protein